MKPKLFLCLALVFGGCLEIVQAGQSFTNEEPRYLDKSLSEWIPLGRPMGEVLIPIDWRSFEAIRQIGTNAIPWLLQWVGSDNPTTAALGIDGLSMLGPSARPAVPELMRLVNDFNSSPAWSNAISALADIRDSNHLSYGFTFLLAEATNMAAPPELRSHVIESLAQMGYHINGVGFLSQLGTNAALVIPVFVHCLQDKDWRVASAAANGLGVYTIEPLIAVPALAASLVSRTNANEVVTSRTDWHGDVVVRDSAVNALRGYANVETWNGFPDTNPPFHRSPTPQYHQALRGAVPSLVKTLSDEQWRIASEAASTLGDAALEPDLAVPALIKCLARPEREVRYAVAEALANFGEVAHSAMPALLQIQQSDTNRDVAWAAATALKKIVPLPDYNVSDEGAVIDRKPKAQIADSPQPAAPKAAVEIEVERLMNWEGDFSEHVQTSYLPGANSPINALLELAKAGQPDGIGGIHQLIPYLTNTAPTKSTVSVYPKNMPDHGKRTVQLNEYIAHIIGRAAAHDFYLASGHIIVLRLGDSPLKDPVLIGWFQTQIEHWCSVNINSNPERRKIADVSDWFHDNRFNAYRWLGESKSAKGRLPLERRVDHLIDAGSLDSMTCSELAACAEALAEIGDRRSVPAVRRACNYIRDYPIHGSFPDHDLFQAYHALARLGEKHAALNELKLYSDKHLSGMETRAQREFSDQFKESESW